MYLGYVSVYMQLDSEHSYHEGVLIDILRSEYNDGVDKTISMSDLLGGSSDIEGNTTALERPYISESRFSRRAM